MADHSGTTSSPFMSATAILLALAFSPLALIALWLGMLATRREPSAHDPMNSPASHPEPGPMLPESSALPVSSQRYWGSGWDSTCGDRPAGFIPPGGL